MTQQKVYVASAGNESIKIGVSKDPEARIQSLSTANPKPVSLERVLDLDYDEMSATEWESTLHRALAEYRLEGEWFEYEAYTKLNGVIEGVGIGQSLDHDMGHNIHQFIDHLEDAFSNADFAPATKRCSIGEYHGMAEVLQYIGDVYNLDHGVCELCEHVAYYRIGDPTQCSRCGASKEGHKHE